MAVMRDENDPWARSARLERENEELARGILELQRKLTISEQAHFLYRSEVDRRLSAAELRKKYAEDQLQTALNLGEMWYQRERRWKEHQLPVVPFPAGEDPEARWGLTDLGRAAMRGGMLHREKKIREAMEPIPGFFAALEFALPSYDLAAACSRCGRTYREHLEPEGPECDGFMDDYCWRKDP